MTDEHIQNLLGGFATDTLSPQERELLFNAALKDQELFNALADEQVLREFLSDPASRRRLLQLLQPDEPGVFERLTSWMRRPASWAVAGGVLAALVVGVAIRQSFQTPVSMVRTSPPSAVLQDSSPVAQPSEPVREEARARRDSPAPLSVPNSEAPSKMKVAVLNFDSGPDQSKIAKEADSASADLGKTASDLFGKKLDANRYTLIDRKQVDKAMQEQKLNERQLDASAAASLGRSLGADAVIVGSVKQSVASARNVGGVVGGARPEAPAIRSKSAAQDAVEVTATAINSQNALRLGFAQGGQNTSSGLVDAVDQVASSLGQQIQQNTRARIDGLVTDVNAKILTLNVGAQAGVKSGDRLEIRRAGKTIGRVAISSVQDSFSVGLFEGADLVKIGDSVANQ